MAYSDKVIDHYENPRNVGSFEKGDDSVGTGMVGAPACGDVMKLQIKVNPETGVIEDARFKTYGCGSAIASSSLVTEWVKGKTLDEAAALKNSADRRRTGVAAGQDPLLHPGRRRHQGGSERLQDQARRSSGRHGSEARHGHYADRSGGPACQPLSVAARQGRGRAAGREDHAAARAWPTSSNTWTSSRPKTSCSRTTASRC